MSDVSRDSIVKDKIKYDFPLTFRLTNMYIYDGNIHSSKKKINNYKSLKKHGIPGPIHVSPKDLTLPDYDEETSGEYNFTGYLKDSGEIDDSYKKSYYKKKPMCSESKVNLFKDKCIVDLIGNLPDGRDITCHIIDYKPHFYIKTNSSEEVDKLQGIIQQLIKRRKCTFRKSHYLYENYNVDLSTVKYYDGNKFKFSRDLFIKLEFNNLGFYRDILKYLKNARQLEEYSFYDIQNPGDKFLSLYDIEPTGAVKIRGGYGITSGYHRTNSNFEFITKTKYIKKVDNEEELLKIKNNSLIMAFDIESALKKYKPNVFPIASRDPIIGVSLIFQWSDESTPVKKYYITSKEHTQSDEYDIIKVENDIKICRMFSKVLRAFKPDRIITFNGDSYDWRYMYARMYFKCYNKAKCPSAFYDFLRLSRYPQRICRYHMKTMNSQAFGTETIFTAQIPG
ncbi:MAG: 3'-5' exonuclease, partial [bacterium]